MKIEQSRFCGCVALALSAIPVVSHAKGQITATFEWLASGDDGATWQNHVMVEQSQANVLIRARVSWDPVSTVYFAQVAFDATVRAASGGFADTVSSLGSQPSFWNYLQTTGFSSTRFGDMLKIDEARDTLAPGLGQYWINPYQSSPLGPPLMHAENPVEFFQFQLNLDGSLGQREISAVFATRPTRPDRYIALYQPPYTQSDIYVPSTFVPATVTVVPSPCASVVSVFMSLVWVARRRR